MLFAMTLEIMSLSFCLEVIEEETASSILHGAANKFFRTSKFFFKILVNVISSYTPIPVNNINVPCVYIDSLLYHIPLMVD